MSTAKDPICGMTVDIATAPAKGTYDGNVVYFCSTACRTTFEARRKGK